MKKILSLLLIFSSIIFSQALEYFPGELNVNPFVANALEPKLGFMFKAKGSELRLDIGNSIDFFHYKSEAGVFSAGADLFTWTLLRKEENFHFPVDAVDYLFGLNFSYKKSFHNYSYGTRIRLSHISAHLVDGHFDKSSMTWLDGQLPRVYSREFVEVMPFYQYKELRGYLGLTYLVHVDPVVSSKDQYQAGFDYIKKDFICDNISPFVAYDIRLTDRFSHSPNHSFHVGVKFGKPNGRGLSLYYHYYYGTSIHGEYYDYQEKYSGFGLNVDL